MSEDLKVQNQNEMCKVLETKLFLYIPSLNPGYIPPVCCLREAVEEGGGIRTLEQEMSEDEAAKMNYPRPMPPRGGKWRAMFCLQKAG